MNQNPPSAPTESEPTKTTYSNEEIDAKLRALLDPMLQEEIPDDMVRMVEAIAAKLRDREAK